MRKLILLLIAAISLMALVACEGGDSAVKEDQKVAALSNRVASEI